MNTTGRVSAAVVASAVAVATPVVAYFEGYIPHTYADPVGIPTICYGHTGPDVTPDRTATRDECESLLRQDLGDAVSGVLHCVRADMQAHQLAALTSFAYNVGAGALCKSTLARKANAGDWPGACAELSRWVYAKGIKLGGLVKRRAAERAMCEGRQ